MSRDTRLPRSRPGGPGSRYGLLFGVLFGLIAVEGGIGLFVLSQFRSSSARLERVETAVLRTDELGMALNNYVKEMKVSTGLSQQAGEMVPLPPTKPLAEGARRLRELSPAGESFPGTTRLLEDSDALVGHVGSYHQLLARRAVDDATLLYIQEIEPVADRLLQADFPQARSELMKEVNSVGTRNRDGGRIAGRLLLGSLAATLGVGLFLLRRILRTLAEASAREKELERRNSEMAIARTIQTSVIPRDLTLEGFDIAAVMMPAAEVGGDFYEFRRTPDGGAWVGIGDVTGHGISAGLIMMMAQSMFTMLAESSSGEPTPSRFLAQLNRALFFNLHSRLGEEKFMTMVVARLFPDGRMVYAGAHTDLLVYRKASSGVERLATDGLWLGVVEDIGDQTTEHEIVLGPGDLALFHTDGVTEARNAAGEPFDIHRVIQLLGGASGGSAGEAVMSILAATRAWSPMPDDDISLMAIRRSRDE